MSSRMPASVLTVPVVTFALDARRPCNGNPTATTLSPGPDFVQAKPAERVIQLFSFASL
jgi:hypothetical protein